MAKAAKKIEWCDNGADGGTHNAPFFTVTVLAVQAGPGTRGRGFKRRILRQTLGRVCEGCLKRAEFRGQGRVLLIAEGSDRARD